MLHREVQGEALTGETDGPAIKPRNQEFGMPMLLYEAEGNMEYGVIRQSCSDPARSETLCTSVKSFAQKLGDLSDARCASTGRSRKGQKA